MVTMQICVSDSSRMMVRFRLVGLCDRLGFDGSWSCSPVRPSVRPSICSIHLVHPNRYSRPRADCARAERPSARSVARTVLHTKHSGLKIQTQADTDKHTHMDRHTYTDRQIRLFRRWTDRQTETWTGGVVACLFFFPRSKNLRACVTPNEQEQHWSQRR